MLVNTIAVAVFQVRLSRGSDTVPKAARRMAVSGFWVLAGFALIALAAGLPPWAAATLLLAGAAVHCVGEMIGSGGQWGVQMGLAPQERQGQYQGLAGMSFSLASILAPPLVAFLCIDWGRPGWLVMGGLVLACRSGQRAGQRLGAAHPGALRGDDAHRLTAGTLVDVPSALPDGEPAPTSGELPSAALARLGSAPFGVYVHVPFCTVRCGYCDFNTYTLTELGDGSVPGAEPRHVCVGCPARARPGPARARRRGAGGRDGVRRGRHSHAAAGGRPRGGAARRTGPVRAVARGAR